MGDNHALEIDDIGIIKTKMFNSTICIIKEILHIKDLKNSLLSLGPIDSLGYKTYVDNKIMKIVRGTLVFMKA